MILQGLKPERVMYYFEELTKIPRGSGNEQAVSDYLVKVGKSLNLEVIQEACLNVIIKKAGSKGKEDHKTVILQGHMDIVCAKEENLEFDFEKDSIPVVVKEDFICTEGTTLGADNGIAVAMALAVLEDDTLSHPPITGLFTVAEETGMDGVIGLESKNIQGDILINIDSEEEGVLLSSCAGGANSIVELPIQWTTSENTLLYQVDIKGLLGGHSGIEIGKMRASAIKLMGRFLKALDNVMDYDLAYISGGEKMNAIPKMSKVKIAIDEKDNGVFCDFVEKMKDIFVNEFKTADPGIVILTETISELDQVFTKETKASAINILRLLPQGVQSMSADMEGLVESSNNVGVLETMDDQVVFTSALRSSVKSLKAELVDRIQVVGQLCGAKVREEADYPEWQYKPKSEIRDLMISTYKEMYNKEMMVDAIHAGLECGFLKEKVGDIDMISLGPNIYEVHTPGEKVSISSIERVYEFLCRVIEKI